MIPVQSVRVQALTPALLKDLASQQGGCITFLIPGSTGGRDSGSRGTVLRGLLRSAPASLLDPQMLEPVDAFANQFEDEGGGPGVALFRAPTFFAAGAVQGLKVASVMRGKYFALAPVAAATLAPQELFILAVHRKNLHLFHYLDGVCVPVPLPASVPADMETALAFDTPDHLLEGRSGSSGGTGSSRAVQFGTSSDKEAQGEYVHHYFRMVDRGLRPLIGDRPILLAGVHDDVVAFRRAASDAKILESEIGGNIDFLRADEIAIRASAAAMAHYYLCGELVLRTQREMRNRELALSDAALIAEAAAAGRIHQLCASDDLDPAASSTDEPRNIAIAETLRHNGEVFIVPASSMGEGQQLAAILRY